MAVLFTYTGTAALGIKIRNAICHSHGYQDILVDPDTLEETDNTETREVFAKRKLKEGIRDMIKVHRRYLSQQEVQAGIDAAVAAAEAEADELAVI